MSRSEIIKFVLLSSLILFAPKLGAAKTLTFGDQKWEISPPPPVYATTAYVRNDFSSLDFAKAVLLGTHLAQSTQILDDATLANLATIEAAVNQLPVDAKLTIENGRATDFTPSQPGQQVDIHALLGLFTSDAATISLPVLVTEPTIELADTNQLGINELVATGVSDFSRSPKNRLVNIRVGADKFNGVIVPAGAEFSFNDNLGPVDAEHGFLPELVIKADGVKPEFGGGLCQVSTTAFRAAMNSGLPITQRRNHSFAVSYYAPQGTDATIYPGSSDLKFINNLSSSLLIHTRIEGQKLYFDYYGTKDDRKISFEGPVQYDRKPDGSMKATWTRHVTMDGTTTTQVFNSTYLPPALFEPVAATPAPPPTPTT